MKQSIRKEILSLRLQLSQEELTQLSEKIQQRVESSHEYIISSGIVFYKSVKNEVLTDNMICNAMDNKKKVFLPVMAEGKKVLEIYELNSLKQLRKGPYNIMEPDRETNRKADLNEAGMVIIPGIAFDNSGNRIGYGKGYYDTFLKGIPAEISKLALAFDFQMVPGIPADRHDIKVDRIATESGIIECG